MSCNKGTYCSRCNTWSTKCGSVNADDWAPYSGAPWFKEGFCNNCNNGYNQSAGFGCGCGYSGQQCKKCGPYNKLGPDNKESYAAANRSWTVGANITPFNHNMKYNYTHLEKEKYTNGCNGCSATPYVRNKQAWAPQKPYST